MSNNSEKLYLENQICFPLYAASRLIIKNYEPLLNKLDITYPQYLVLMVLWENNNLTVKEIGALLLLESNTLTPLLKRLENKGFLIRKRSKEDERKVIILLTQAGEELKNDALCIPDQLIESFEGSNVSESEISTFRDSLKKLITHLS